MSGVTQALPERSLLSAAAPPTGAPPENPAGRLMRLFNELIDIRHARLAHARTHVVGETCARCGIVILDDRAAQAAYDAAWHELFDPPSCVPPSR